MGDLENDLYADYLKSCDEGATQQGFVEYVLEHAPPEAFLLDRDARAKEIAKRAWHENADNTYTVKGRQMSLFGSEYPLPAHFTVHGGNIENERGYKRIAAEYSTVAHMFVDAQIKRRKADQIVAKANHAQSEAERALELGNGMKATMVRDISKQKEQASEAV